MITTAGEAGVAPRAETGGMTGTTGETRGATETEGERTGTDLPWTGGDRRVRDLRPEMRDARLLLLVTTINFLPTEIPPGPPKPRLLNQLLLPLAMRFQKPIESIRSGKLAELSSGSTDVEVIFYV